MALKKKPMCEPAAFYNGSFSLLRPMNDMLVAFSAFQQFISINVFNGYSFLHAGGIARACLMSIQCTH